MPSSVFVRVEGLLALGERLRLIESKVSLKIGAKAVGQGAKFIKDLAILHAPESAPDVTPDIPYQRLKKNIVAKKIKSPLVAEYIVTVRGKKKDFYAARVGRLQEYGTVKMAAHPFMRPAFDQGKATAVQIIKTTLKEGIENA